MKIIEKKAPAKINLGLMLIGRRRDKFHNLQMLNAPISLHDKLTFEPFSHDCIEFVGADIDPEDNTIMKVIRLIKSEYKEYAKKEQSVKVTVEKNIPLASGLGGESSDAAAAIFALNELWELELPEYELVRLAGKVGSDVPFFMQDSWAIVAGRGESVTPAKTALQREIFLIIPDYPLATPTVFRKIKKPKPTMRFTNMLAALQEGSFALTFNDLTDKADRLALGAGKTAPSAIVGQARAILGVEAAVMTGSGPAVVVFVTPQSDAEQIGENLKRIFPNYTIIPAKL